MNRLFNKFTIALLLLTAITGVMFISCNDDESCSFKDPVQDLPWLNKIITQRSVMEVIQFNYKQGEIGFIVRYWNSQFQNYYTCSGLFLGQQGGFTGAYYGVPIEIDNSSSKTVYESKR